MKKRSAVFLGLLVLALHSVFADYNKSGVADSSEIRRNLVETWFEAPLSAVRMNRPEIRTNSIGQKFQVRLEESEDFFSVFVAPYARMEIDVYSDKGKSTEMQEVYPGDVPGSWVLVRDKKSGAPLRIRYYFASAVLNVLSVNHIKYLVIKFFRFSDCKVTNFFAIIGISS